MAGCIGFWCIRHVKKLFSNKIALKRAHGCSTGRIHLHCGACLPRPCLLSRMPAAGWCIPHPAKPLRMLQNKHIMLFLSACSVSESEGICYNYKKYKIIGGCEQTAVSAVCAMEKRRDGA